MINSTPTETKQRRILGLPERFAYRIGILVFYIFLFFAISMATKKIRIPADSSNHKTASATTK